MDIGKVFREDGRGHRTPMSPEGVGAAVAVVVFAAAFIPLAFLWNRSSAALDREMRASLLDTARSAALLIDGDLHPTFTHRDQEQGEAYRREVAKMRQFMEKNPRLAYLYTGIIKGDTVHFVLDAAPPGDADGDGIDDHSYIMDAYDDPPEEFLTALRDHVPMVDRAPYADKWGTFMSGYAPIHNSRGEPVGIIGADISIDEISASQSAIRQAALLGLILALLCAGATGFAVWVLRSRAASADLRAETERQAKTTAEFRYQHFFQQVPVGIINFNHDLIVTDCNRRMLEISGMSRDDLVGMNLNRLGESRLLPCLKDALESRESLYIGRHELAGEAGANKWVEIHAGPVKNSEGKMTGGIAAVEDITLRHEAEMMSETEKYLLGMIARGEPLDAILLKLVQSIELMMPDSLCSILLLDKEGKRLMKGAGPSLPPGYADAVDGAPVGPREGSCGTAAFTGRPVITTDIQVDPLWENYRDIAAKHGLRSCWSMPVKSGHDKVLGTFAVYHRTIYKPAMFERTLLERASYLAGIAIERFLFEQAISEERNLLRTLIDNIPDIIYIKDRFHRYLAANRAAVAHLHAGSEEDLIGQTDDDILPPEEAKTNRDIEAGIFSGEADIDRLSTDVDHLGRVQYLSLSRMPLRSFSGEIIGMVMIGRDITDRKHIEEDRIKTQKLESLGILAGGIAHDFNNILTSILGNLSFINSHERGLSSEGAELLREAEGATHRAKALTQQLLTFAKGGLPIKKPSDVGKLIREAGTFALRGSASRLAFDIPSDLWMADIDAGQISQVIQNLLFNADQAMSGGGTILVTGRNLQLESDNPYNLEPGCYLSFSVIDQGPGIPREITEKIFDPYFTTKKAGSGLGLTTTFSIIKKHGGHIYVQTTHQRGSTFTFLVPALQEPPRGDEAGSAIAAAPSNAHVLIMDDEDAILKISSRIMERAGYTVSSAHDGEEAIALFKAAAQRGRPVDIAVLDLTIPGGMGGKETFEHLRALNPKARAVVSSGYSVDEIMARHEDFGFAGVLTKPYSGDELLNAIQSALAMSPA